MVDGLSGMISSDVTSLSCLTRPPGGFPPQQKSLGLATQKNRSNEPTGVGPATKRSIGEIASSIPVLVNADFG